MVLVILQNFFSTFHPGASPGVFTVSLPGGIIPPRSFKGNFFFSCSFFDCATIVPFEKEVEEKNPFDQGAMVLILTSNALFRGSSRVFSVTCYLLPTPGV